ncbi:hypothetical protein J6590_033146 [Homalodisca vitripennis]|nr:hypothetical protein J6590_033146 [Homalodisca vitripennis]
MSFSWQKLCCKDRLILTRQVITVCNTKHSGAHPATFRQLMSPKHGQIPASPTPRPAMSTPFSPAPSTLPSSVFSSTPDYASFNSIHVEDLTAENKLLMEKILDPSKRFSAHITAPHAAMTVDCATRYENPSLGKQDKTDASMKYKSLTIPAMCKSEQCCVNRDRVQSLKTTMRF